MNGQSVNRKPTNVIPEQTLIGLLRSGLELSTRALDEIENGPVSQPASENLYSDYCRWIGVLHQQKSHDSTLADHTWEWIWEVKPRLKAVQIYGRIAWVNVTLFDLL